MATEAAKEATSERRGGEDPREGKARAHGQVPVRDGGKRNADSLVRFIFL